MRKDKFLIVRAGALGDTLMLLPSIKALKKNYEITVLGRRPGIDYLESFVDKCIDIERGGWHRLFSREADIANIPSLKADRVIAFINDNENIVSGNLYRLCPGSRINIFPPFPAPDSKTHIALYMARAIQSTGLSVDYEASFDSAFKKPLMQSGKGEGKMVVLHPGSGSKIKNYSPDFWSSLLTRIKEETENKTDINFLLGPAEEDIIPAIEIIAGEFNAELYVCPDKEELLSILNNSYLYIGHDSGVTHLAAMLGINTIALFKNSPVEQWHPLGPNVKIIHREENEKRVLERVLSEIISVPKR